MNTSRSDKNKEKTTDTALISVENCGLSIASSNILSDVNVKLHSSMLHCIVGPNGAGKSTLLKLLSGELSAQHGTIYINDQAIPLINARQLAEIRAVVPQSYNTNFPFQVSDVVEMAFGALSPSDYKNREDHKARALEIMDVKHLWSRRFDRLSGGEQQRVLCARSLLQIAVANERLNGKILLLDEPTSNLDIQYQLSLLQHLAELCDRGLCVVIILHQLPYCYQFADQVVLLFEGKLVACGSADQVLSNSNLQNYFAVQSDLLQDSEGNNQLLLRALETKSTL